MTSSKASREARYIWLLTLLVLSAAAAGWVASQLLPVTADRVANYLYIAEIGGLLSAYLRERDLR